MILHQKKNRYFQLEIIDLEDKRKISKEEGEQLAKKYGIMFSECSAKTGENVNYIFNELIKKCYPLIKNAK